MGQTERDRQKRGRLQRQVKPQNHAGGHVDRHGQRRPAKRVSRDRIDHRHIGPGVIDLDDIQRVVRRERTGRGQVPAFSLVSALPPQHEPSLVFEVQPTPQTSDRGRCQPPCVAIGSDLPPEPRFGRFATGGVKVSKQAGYDRFHRRIQRLHPRLGAGRIRQKRTGPRIFLELLRQTIDRRPADIQLPHRLGNVAFGELFRQLRKQFCADLGLFPIFVGCRIIGHDLIDARTLCSLTNNDSHTCTVS